MSTQPLYFLLLNRTERENKVEMLVGQDNDKLNNNEKVTMKAKKKE